MIFMMSKETVKQLRLLSWWRKLSGKPRQTEISQQRLSLPVQQSSPHHSSSLEIIGEIISAFGGDTVEGYMVHQCLATCRSVRFN